MADPASAPAPVAEPTIPAGNSKNLQISTGVGTQSVQDGKWDGVLIPTSKEFLPSSTSATLSPVTPVPASLPVIPTSAPAIPPASILEAQESTVGLSTAGAAVSLISGKDEGAVSSAALSPGAIKSAAPSPKKDPEVAGSSVTPPKSASKSPESAPGIISNPTSSAAAPSKAVPYHPDLLLVQGNNTASATTSKASPDTSSSVPLVATSISTNNQSLLDLTNPTSSISENLEQSSSQDAFASPAESHTSSTTISSAVDPLILANSASATPSIPKNKELSAASASADQPGSTFPPPGSPEEATILAVVSSTITFSGSLAVSAIKAGATQLDSSAAKGKESEEEGGLNGFAIAGIVAGGVLGLFIIVLVWYKLRKRCKIKKEERKFDEQDESPRPHTGFDFTDDPITASTSRFRPVTQILPTLHTHSRSDSGPFDDRYQSQCGPQSWYNPHHPSNEEISHAAQYRQEVIERDRGHTDQSRDERERQYEYDRHQQNSRATDGLDELYEEDDTKNNPSRRIVENPFVPPVPDLPSSNYRGGGDLQASRPETSLTNIYGSYESRPTTEIQDQVNPALDQYDDDDRELTVQTPATSSLLPWLNQKKQTKMPVMPTGGLIRIEERVRMADVPQDAAGSEDGNAAGVGAGSKGKGKNMMKGVMAQTPIGVGGREYGVAVDPGFR